MRILHVTPHFGGGVGTVLLDWLVNDLSSSFGHEVVSLDFINEKAQKVLKKHYIPSIEGHRFIRDKKEITSKYDIVLVHWWDSPDLKQLFSEPFPASRLIFWCHKNYPLSIEEKSYPDAFYGTAPCQGLNRYIWSTRDMDMFLNTKKQEHDGFNVGTIGSYKKLLPLFYQLISSNNLIFAGDIPAYKENDYRITNYGKVDDDLLMDIYSVLDVFFYPLRDDHYGTCEQVLGEAMSAQIVPIVLDNPCERDIVENGVNGFIATEINDLQMFIYILQNYPDIRKRMEKNAAESAYYKYNQFVMRNNWHNAFDQIMENKKVDREPLFGKSTDEQDQKRVSYFSAQRGPDGL